MRVSLGGDLQPGLVDDVQQVLGVDGERVGGRQHLLLVVLLQRGEHVLLGQLHLADQLCQVRVQQLLGHLDLEESREEQVREQGGEEQVSSHGGGGAGAILFSNLERIFSACLSLLLLFFGLSCDLKGARWVCVGSEESRRGFLQVGVVGRGCGTKHLPVARGCLHLVCVARLPIPLR